MLGPRLVVAGVSSGVGKTTVATGLMAALRARGVRVAGAKVGPDFIDPGYHAIASGRPGRNLDSWICGEAVIPALAGRAALGADLLVVEGVMGLFDGAADGAPEASTASIARLLGAPVVLVVDASAMSGSVAALVHGYRTFDPALQVAGVVLNRVGGPGHEQLLRDALAPIGVPVVGVLHRRDDFVWRDRHLGLVPVVEDPGRIGRTLGQLAAAVEATVDLDAVMGLAARAPTRAVPAPPTPRRAGRVRIAVASGAAFDFVYRDNLEALEAAGAELAHFNPLHDAALPEGTDALYAGGGFPEVFAAELADNRSLLADLRRQVARGMVVWGECGGLLWLSEALDGHRLAGVVPARATMGDRLALGYRRAEVLVDCPLGPAGTALRGHEFHYSVVEPPGAALELSGRGGRTVAGHAHQRLLATYLHVHLGGDPSPAEHLVTVAARHPGHCRGSRRSR